jgi:hypothetical protein
LTVLKKGPSKEFPTIQAVLGQTSKPMEGKQAEENKGMHFGIYLKWPTLRMCLHHFDVDLPFCCGSNECSLGKFMIYLSVYPD